MRLGILTDVHLCPPGTAPDGCHNPYAFDQAETLLTRAIAAHTVDAVDALLVLGDLANRGDAPSLGHAVRLLADADLPAWITGGNHDREEDAGRLAAMVAAASPSLRMAGPDGQLVGGLRVAGLPITSPGAGTPWLVDRPPLDAWDDDPVLLLSHFPVLAREAAIVGAGLRYVGSFEDREGIAPALLGRTAPTVVLHGHLHVRDAVAAGPVLQIGCAALIEPPHERVVVDLPTGGWGGTVRVRHIPVVDSPPVRLPVVAPASSEWAFRDGGWQPGAGGGLARSVAVHGRYTVEDRPGGRRADP